MAHVNTKLFESFSYPSWWLSFNGLELELLDGTIIQTSRVDTEFLPQGLAVQAGSGIGHLIPWSSLKAARTSMPLTIEVESN